MKERISSLLRFILRALNGERYPNFYWLDKNKRTFRFNKISQKNRNWTDVHGKLFKDYQGSCIRQKKSNQPRQRFLSALTSRKRHLTEISDSKKFRDYQINEDSFQKYYMGVQSDAHPVERPVTHGSDDSSEDIPSTGNHDESMIGQYSPSSTSTDHDYVPHSTRGSIEIPSPYFKSSVYDSPQSSPLSSNINESNVEENVSPEHAASCNGNTIINSYNAEVSPSPTVGGEEFPSSDSLEYYNQNSLVPVAPGNVFQEHAANYSGNTVINSYNPEISSSATVDGHAFPSSDSSEYFDQNSLNLVAPENVFREHAENCNGNTIINSYNPELSPSAIIGRDEYSFLDTLENYQNSSVPVATGNVFLEPSSSYNTIIYLGSSTETNESNDINSGFYEGNQMDLDVVDQLMEISDIYSEIPLDICQEMTNLLIEEALLEDAAVQSNQQNQDISDQSMEVNNICSVSSATNEDHEMVNERESFQNAGVQSNEGNRNTFGDELMQQQHGNQLRTSVVVPTSHRDLIDLYEEYGVSEHDLWI